MTWSPQLCLCISFIFHFLKKNFLPTHSHMSLILPLPQFSHHPTLWYLLFLLFQPHQSSMGALIGQGRREWSRGSQNLFSSLNTVNDPSILLASTDLQECSFFFFFKSFMQYRLSGICVPSWELGRGATNGWRVTKMPPFLKFILFICPHQVLVVACKIF